MAALDEVLLSLGGSFVPVELAGSPRAATRVAARAVRAWRETGEPGNLLDAQAWLAAGWAGLARGDVTAARRLFARSQRCAPPESTEALLARLADLLACYTGYGFLPGEGVNSLLTEAVWRLDLAEVIAATNASLLRQAWSEPEPWWPPIVTLLGEVIPHRRSVLGPDFQTGRLHSPDSAQRLASLVGQFCDRLQAEAEAASLPVVAAYAKRTAAEIARRLGDPAGPARLQEAADAYQAAGFPAGQAACVLQAAEWLLAPFSGSVALDTAAMESATADCALPAYEALEMQRLGADPGPAAGLAAQAAEIFTALDAERGLAAVALHRSYAAFSVGSYAEQRAQAGKARRHATAAGDAWLASAAVIHQIAADIGAGVLGGHDQPANWIGRWGRRSGSFTHALGLGFVLTRLGRFWLIRRSDPDRAAVALACARHLFTALGAPQNALQCGAETAGIQAWLGLRAVSQTAMRDTVQAYLDDAERRPQVRHAALRRARDLTGTLLSETIAGSSPAACTAAADLAERVRAVTGPVPDESPAELLTQGRFEDFERALYAGHLSQAIPQVRCMAHLMGAREARAQGDMAGYDVQIRAALDVAAAMPFPVSVFHEAVVLGAARRYDDAAAAYTRFLAAGGHDAQMADVLAPMHSFAVAGSSVLDARAHSNDGHAARFFARIRRYDRASAHLAAVTRLAGREWWKKEPQPWEARALIGEIREGLGDLPGALAAYDEALSLAEADLRHLLRDDQRTAFTDRRLTRSVYLASARAAHAAGRGSDTDAFNRAERGRARALTVLLAGSRRGDTMATEDADLVRRWREAAARADALTNAEALADAAADSPLAQAAARARDALRKLDDEVRRRADELATVLNPTAEPVDADEVSQALPPRAVLLTWIHVDDDVLAFVLPAGGEPRCHQSSIDADDLAATLNGFARACREGAPWRDGAADVARVLIAPFAREISDADAVLVVPFLAGHRVPVHLLPLDGEALGAHRTVSYLPATSIIRNLASRPVDEAAGLAASSRLIVGSPARMAWTPPGSDTPVPYRPLEFAETEARAITRLGDVSLIGPAATKANVMPELSRHRVVHFASHAHVTADAPQLSAVLLAGGDTLSVADLVGTGLPADLAVLSACDTGTGLLTDGDEIVGLTRGLFAAGARQAVVSLWPANDLATCLLMRRFYAGLAGAGAAEALRRACRELATLDLGQQVDELMALRAELSSRETPQPVLETIERAAAMRRGRDRDRSEVADLFTHPRIWAPFVHLGLP
jgi:CHAT domain-containing protein